MADIRINALATTATTPASDDYLALDGTAQGTRKILATNIANNVTDVILGTSGPSVKSSLSARAPRQGLVFDGTAGADVASVPAFGTGDFTFAAWVNQSSLAAAYLCSASAAPDSAFLYLVGDGTFQWWSNSVARATSSAGAIVANKWTLLTATRTGGTTTLYANGVSVGSGADSQNLASAINKIGQRSGGTNILNGSLIPLIYNRALSASEVVALYEAGAPSGADYPASGQAAGTSVVGTSFASGWSTDGGFTAGTNAVFTSTGNAYKLGVLTSGKRYRLSVEIVSADAGAVLNYYNGGAYVVISSAGSTGVKTVEFTAAGTTFVIGPQVGSGGMTLTAPSIYPLGLLLAPDAAQAGGGYVWNDQSGNLAQIVLPSSGVQWNLPSVAGQRIRGTTSTNGNQQLLGASVLLPAECQITHVRARAQSGTPTITIGTASGGAQIVASVALSTTWLNCTIALTGGIVSSADDIWVGSNSTDVVETDIAFQPLDF